MVLLGSFAFSKVLAQAPLSFEVENRGADCNVSAGALSNNQNLPDPFSFNDGSRVSTFEEWSCRRNEIKADIEQYEIGSKPDKPENITASYSGGTLTVNVTVNGQTLTLTSEVNMPSGTGPFPVVIGMNAPTGQLSSGLFNGVIQVSFNHNQVALYSQGTRDPSYPFFDLYPELTSNGYYSAWSWGISRIIDGIEIVQNQMNADLGRIAVTGCSYAGKMALFAGAFDERIALTIAQESGGGGINSWRTSQDYVDRTGTNIEKINNTNGSWFMQSMMSRDPYSLPHDHHELIAMIAPRAFLALGNSNQVWLGDESGYKSIMAATEVWKAMGVEDRIGFDFTTNHPHCSASNSQNTAVTAFVDKFLKNNTSTNTNFQVNPSQSGFDLNYAQKIDWTTPEISFNPNVPKVTITSENNVLVSETISITAEVEDLNNDVNNVEFFVDGQKIGEDATAPYAFDWSSTTTGSFSVEVIATDAEDNTGSATMAVSVRIPQGPYGGTAHPIPGTIELEEYDVGGNGFAYYDDSPGTEVSNAPNFRTDEDVDIETATDDGGGYNLGWTTVGEWLEYTVDVTQSGIYDIELRVACDGDDRSVNLSLDGKSLASNIEIPNTAGWQAWETITISDVSLTSGEQILRLTIGGEDYVNLNYVTFVAKVVTDPPTVSLTNPIDGETFTTADIITLTADAADPDGSVAKVDFYSGDDLIESLSQAPFTFDWENPTGGTYTITAVATDDNGVSTTSEAVSITIRVVGTPFGGTPHTIPGRIEAEHYDLGGEGLGFHEENADGNEGESDYRGDEVDVEETLDTEGDYNIGYILNGEWLAYTIDVPQSGMCDLDLRVAVDGDNRSMHIEIDGQNVSGPIAIPNTTGYQVWETVTVEDIPLTAGGQQIRLVFDANYMNLNYFHFKSDLITSVFEEALSEVKVYSNPFSETGFSIQAEENTSYLLYDVSGRLVSEGRIQSNEKIAKGLPQGMYLLQTVSPSGVNKSFKITKK